MVDISALQAGRHSSLTAHCTFAVLSQADTVTSAETPETTEQHARHHQ
jgi:hypothetical protein